MSVSALKSPAITNLDAIPVVPNTTGEGAPGYDRAVEGFITTVAADSIASTYRLVRLPSNAKVKSVEFRSEAQGAGAVRLSAYYSDSTTDGTQKALQGLIVPTTGDAFFSGNNTVTAAVTPVNVLGTGGSVQWNMGMWNQPLWQALGLTSDPGGFIDIVGVVNTTAITTGAARLGVRVEYVE